MGRLCGVYLVGTVEHFTVLFSSVGVTKLLSIKIEISFGKGETCLYFPRLLLI